MSDLSVYNRTMLNVNTDPSLSLAAVGLWHKMNAAYGRNFDRVDILTLHPDPNAWGPNDEEHDLDGPLDELIALGYAETRGKTVSLFFGGHAACATCGGHVSTGSYCAECGLLGAEGDE